VAVLQVSGWRVLVLVVVAIVLEVGDWGISELDWRGQLVWVDDHVVRKSLQMVHATRMVDALLCDTARTLCHACLKVSLSPVRHLVIWQKFLHS
jgi:hypothetical protein